ncbi:MAG: hypothetical protein R3C45_14450 [Phycisphaerales bacterium]
MGLIKLQRTLPTLAAAATLAAGSTGYAVIYEDFQFNDANGTLLAAAVNSANPGNFMFEDDVDMAPSAVIDGVYRINKANDNLGHNYLDIADITSGVRYLVMEVAGWNIVADNLAEPEDVILSFLDNPSIPGGSTRTADINFSLFTPTVLRLQGTALGTNATSTGSLDLSLSHPDPMILSLKLDKDTDTYELMYKDGSNPWASLGTGNLGNKLDESDVRDGNTLRFRAQNNFGAVGEYFDVDRIYLTDVDPSTFVPLVGDLNDDGFVGIGDLNIVLGAWNQNVAAGNKMLGDPSGDGFVGIEDLNEVLGN